MSPGEEQHPNNPAQGKRQGHNDDQRVYPALKVNNQKKVDKHNRESHSKEEAIVALKHGFDLPAKRDLYGGFVRLAGKDLLDLCRGRSEIAALHVGLNIENRHDVELRRDNRQL